MRQDLINLTINPERFKVDFDELSQIGSTREGGVNRPALSPTHLEARAWFLQKAERSGLDIQIDKAGNHSAFLACGQAGVPTLLLGSHLDSVPNGGKYDGSLGVLAALEVLRVVKEIGLELPVNLEAIDFTDEEGTLVSFLGSFAISRKLTSEMLEKPRGGRGALEAGLMRAGLTEEGVLTAQRDPRTLAGYLELHVEQGKQLVNGRAQIGVVTNIAGISFYQLAFLGRADHAGTIPMEERLDASQGASAFTLAAREIVMNNFPGCFSNIGQVEYKPGVFNIVPERAILSLEFRSQVLNQLKSLEAALLARAKEASDQFGLGLEVKFLGRRDPALMSEVAQQAIIEATNQLGLKYMKLPSLAGHDAQSIADLCPTGMIFLPSVAGASHSPREFTEWQDCVNGANVLLQAALRMALKLSSE